ncbi:MAG: arylsulfatase [Gammaproteobacteria bacterium]|nr:arylsulfatase [Gammaproteobacteria bacterium]
MLTAFSVNVQAATNLVFLVADDMGWGDVGYHDSEIRTPTIDQLASQGTRLERFYAHPLCSPTRGALMTGRSPLTTGVLMPFEPWFTTGLPLTEKLLPQYLKDAGYQTFAVGKWHLGPNHLSYHPLNRGFDHYYGHLGGFINYDLHTIWRGVDWQRNGQTLIEEGYSTHLITNEAVRLIKNRDKDVPMFLYVTFNAPHSPLQAPEHAVAEYADIEDSDRRTYAAMVTEMDRGIGQILATLDDEGLGENTLVIFMSDYGGAPPLGASNGELRGGKGSTWEGGIRVPALMRLPGRLQAGKSHDEMMSVEDILPTVLGALDMSPDWENPLDGSNQWPAIADGRDPEDRVRILVNHNRRDYSIALFSEDWKLVRMQDRDSGQTQVHLFRIDEDPYEKNDLASEYPDVVEQLLSEFQSVHKAPIVGLDDPPIPTRTGLGGPASLVPDDRPPNKEPYAESALRGSE